MRRLVLVAAAAALFAAGYCSSARASVSSTSSYVDALGNGATYIFTFTFPVTTSSSDVEVFLAGVKQSSGYTVALNLDQVAAPGGTVTFLNGELPNPPANGVLVRIQRTVPLTQVLSLSAYSAYRAKDVEKALDRLAYQAQQIRRYTVLDQDARDDAQEALLQSAILGSYGWLRAVATADTVSSTNPGATDIAGLSFATASGKKYLVRATLFTYAAATTTGLGVSAKATGAPTTSSQFFHQLHFLDTGNDATLAASAFADTPATFGATLRTAASSPQVDRFDGYFVTTGTGTFQLRLITELDGSAVTVKAGSHLEWMEL